MKNPILCFGSVFLALSSCCHKKDCEFYIEEIKLQKYSSNDLDSIIFKTYLSSNNQLVDSSLTKAQTNFFIDYENPSDTTFYLQLPIGFEFQHKYQINFLKANQIIYLGGFQKINKKCNSCFPVGETTFITLGSYSVNGEKVVGGNLVLSKQ